MFIVQIFVTDQGSHVKLRYAKTEIDNEPDICCTRQIRHFMWDVVLIAAHLVCVTSNR
jgi:hypothetical protein